MIRENRITFLANEQEQKALEEAAKAAGIPVGTFCRMAALEKAKQARKE